MAATAERIARQLFVVFVLTVTWKATYGSRWDDPTEQQDFTSKSEELEAQSKRQSEASDFEEDRFWKELIPKELNLRSQLTTGQCFDKEMHQMIKEDVCKPRPSLVEIPNESSLDRIIPGHVILNRCGGGYRDGYFRCIAVTSKVVEIPVIKVPFAGNKPGLQQHCDKAILEDHETCVLGCSLKPNDCNTNQVFSKEDCKCLCAERSEDAKCHSPKQIWVDTTCSCECLSTAIHECSTGFAFNYEECRCTRLYNQRSLSRWLSLAHKRNSMPLP